MTNIESPVSTGAITNFRNPTPTTEVAQPLEPQGIVVGGIGKVTPIVSVANVFGASGLQTDVTTKDKPNSQLYPGQVRQNREQIISSATNAKKW